MLEEEILSTERLINGLKSFGGLKNTSRASIICYSALILILIIAFSVRILPIRWEIPSGTIRLNEFDPYYQFSLTNHMVENGLLSPYYPEPGWRNEQLWYPQGLDMSNSLPSLPMTATILFGAVSFFGVNIDLMAFCALLPAVLGAFACLLLYFVGKDMGGKTIGLFSALFLALSPSFLQRSSLGFFDSELPGMIGLLLFIFMFLRSIDSKRTLLSSMLYSLASAGSLAYFILGWGAAYFLVNLTVLFVFVLLLLKRYSQRLLISYSITFGLALFIATKWPYISTGYLISSAILPVAAMFVLLCLAELLRHDISSKTKIYLTIVAIVATIGAITIMWQLGYMEGIAGKFITVLDPRVRSTSPLIESVAEHRISSWGYIYYELGLGVLFFLTGTYFAIKNPTNRNVFLLIFGATSLYFASSMVRLLVIFAPAYALLASKGIMGLLKPFFALLKESSIIAGKSKRRLHRVGKEYAGGVIALIFILLVLSLSFTPQNGGIPRAITQAYSPITLSSGGLPIAPSEPVNEWLDMLNYTSNNLQSTDVVCAWWDYGYWLGIPGNVTSLADNATVDTTKIEDIGFIFMAPEHQSIPMLARYDAKYILVFHTVFIGVAQDQTSYIATSGIWGDEGKWSWMASISGDNADKFIQGDWIDEDSMWIDETDFGSVNTETGTWIWNTKGRDSTIYKLMSWARQLYTESDAAQANAVLPDEVAIEPTYFKPAYISGVDISPFEYGGVIPLVALYEIDYEGYYNATST
jgi:dolichyl-diphosphooligosaccharide--protein glycosyltransferase